jgi:putative ABC transport system permease protein
MSVRYRTRATLVAVQIALSVVLLVSAGLLLRTFLHVQRVDPGFRADQALTFRVAVPFQRYRPPAAFNSFSRELQRKLAAIPGVTGVGAISHVPYDDLPNWGTSYLSDVSPNDAGAPQADARAVTPGLFEALGVQLVEGRFFTDADQDPAHPVAIVDDKLAGRMWPSRSALGERLAVDPLSTGIPNVKVTIVGVVRHLRVRSLVADLTEQIFFSERFVLRNPMAYIVRVNGDPAARSADVRQAIAELDPRLPIYDVRPFDSYVAGARAARRFTLQLAGAFAAAALLLACVGVYGVLAYAVTRRRHEFGVRRALGADGSRIIRDVMAEGLRVAGIGCAVGIAAAVVTSQLLGAQLYGVAPRDPVTFLSAGLLLAAASAVACWIPARRATAVSPMDALRTE